MRVSFSFVPILGLLALFGCPALSWGQQAGLELGIDRAPQDSLRIRYASDPGSDFVLLRGFDVQSIHQALSTNAGVTGDDAFMVEALPVGPDSFFRIERRSGTVVPNLPPVVTLLRPLPGSAFTAPANFAFDVSATDPEGEVVAVEFYMGTNLVGAASSPPYTFELSDVPSGDYVLRALGRDSQGLIGTSVVTPVRVLEPELASLTRIETSPFPGETGVAVTRETVVRFDLPLAADTMIPNDAFFAHTGDRRILSRVDLSTDRQTATLFYLENLPAASRVRVNFDGSQVSDFLGRAVDADGDGQPGGTLVFDFDTVSIAPIAGTAIQGRVLRSDLAPGDLASATVIERPLEGVIVEVIGAEETLRTTTDVEGEFTLNPSPSGRFFVRIDGRPSTSFISENPSLAWAERAYYPVIEKAWEAVAGQSDNLAAGTGVIYLPLVVAGTLRPVSATEDTVITFPDSVSEANPAFSGVQLVVPANSLVSANGTRGGRVGLAPVASDRLPEPLPPGLTHLLDISIQTDGAANFDRPAPIRFPNLPDPVTGEKLPPGAKSALWSFNHDLGEWTISGSMTVTADGDYIETDPGVGVIQPGWHGTWPGGSNPPNCKPKPPREDVNLVDLVKRAWDCAKGFTKINEGIKCAVDLFIALVDQARFIRGVIEQVKSNEAADTCLYATLALESFARSKEIIERLESCVEEASPVKRAEAAVACLQTLLDFAKSECNRVDSGGGTGPCDAGWITRILCKGVDVVHAFLAEAQKMLLKILELMGKVKPASRALDALVEALRLLLNEVCTGEPAGHLTLASPGTARDRLIAILEEADAVLAPFANAPEIWDQFDDALTQLAYATDGMKLGADAFERLGRRPDYYVAVETDRGVLRRRMGVGGADTLFLPGAIPYVISEYHPGMRVTGRTEGRSAPIGASVPLAEPALLPDSTLQDTDGDGLSDLAEFIIGTNPTNPDTDGDGIPDGVEIDQGTNPLDNLPATTGVIASSDTPGIAVDLTAIDDRVFVADGEAGVAIFDAAIGQNPLRIAQIDTPGNAIAVATAGGWLAVADGSAGLAIIEVPTTGAPRLVRQLGPGTLGGGAVQAVATAAGLAFAGTTEGQVAVVELATGDLFQRRNLGGLVEDLAIEGTTLYAWANGQLQVFAFGSGLLEPRGSVPIAGAINAAHGRGRLFVGDDRAYATRARGISVFDLSNPDAPTLLQANETAQQGWKHIVLNGSGRGLATVGANPSMSNDDGLSLYDTTRGSLGDNEFVTRFATPGIARAISLYNGLAYVADHASGLQVVNYLPYDSLGQAPSVELLVSETNQVSAGGLVILRARVLDDVQVRNVRFMVNGENLVLDGTFPFEHVYRVPTNLVGQSLEFTAVATDTGGNQATANVAIGSVVPDNQPPAVAIDSPTGSEAFNIFDNLLVRVSAADASGIAELWVELDGVRVPARRLSFGEFLIDLPRAIGGYRLTAVAIDNAGLSAVSVPVPIAVYAEAISREISVFNFGAADHSEAISREVTTFNFGPQDTIEAISREVTAFNFGQEDTAEAISREISVENIGPPAGTLGNVGQK